jgi:monofunctional glycosyltransferase
MESTQFPPNELAGIFNKILEVYKAKKISSVILYIAFLVYFSIPSFSIPVLEYGTFRITSLMEQRALENNLIYYPEHSWTGINQISPSALKAVISMEDGSFFRHKGIDWKELNTSLKVNLRRGRSVRGGSTITMQTAKNLFLTTNKSLLRKTKEFIITFRMEKELTKKGILRNYINAVEWGEGIYGIGKASEVYFKKDPRDLNANESARLAAVIPSPLKHSPNNNSAYVLRRSSIIKGRLNDVVLFPAAPVKKIKSDEKKRVKRIN